MWTASHQWNGTLLNQSLGGIGLTIDLDSDRLSIGDEVRVQYDDTEAVGFVRFLSAKDTGFATLGIAWDLRETSRKSRKNEAMFLVTGPIDVVCWKWNLDAEKETTTFELWDGAEFTEPTDRLKVRSQFEREELLRSRQAEDVSTLLKLYKLADVDCPNIARQRVIDFEFTR